MTTQRLDRPGPGAMLALAGVAIGIAILVFGAGSWAGTYYSNVRIASIAVATVGLVSWLVLALVRPAFRPASQLLLAFAAAILAFAISGSLAANARLALDYAGYAILLTALYLLLVRLWSTPSIARQLSAIAVIACAATGVVFIAVTISTWLNLWNTLGRLVMPPLRLTYEGLWTGTPNVLAAFLVLLATVALPRLWEGDRRSRSFAVGLAVLVAIDVFLTASRGAWLALAIAVPVTAIAWAVTRPKGARLPAGVRLSRRSAGVTIAAAVAAVLILGVTLGPVLIARLSVTGADLRSAFLAASWRMFVAHPLTGIGPGGWTPARIAFTDASEIDYYIPHAHNLPAQVLAEFGIVGVVASIVVVATLAWMIYRAISSDESSLRLAGLAALFACVYLGCQQLVDEFIQQPAILFAFALPIARADALVTAAVGSSGRSASSGRLLTVGLLVAVIVGAVAALVPERAAIPYERAVTAANAGEWRDAYRLSSEAVAMDPHLAPYQLVRGLGAAELGDLPVARDAFAQAARLDDYPASWLNLAAVQLRMSDPAARASLDEAVRLGRQQPQIAVPAADLYRQLGDPAKARELLGAAFAVAPSLVSDPTWSTGPWQQIASGAIDDALGRANPWAKFRLALEAGRMDLAREIVPLVEPSRRALAEATLDAWNGDVDAFQALHALAHANPMDETTVGLCRRVARVHDPDGNAPGWTCDGGWWYGVYPIVRIGDSQPVGPMPGPAAYPHALYAYRRPGPSDTLVPWLLHIYATVA